MHRWLTILACIAFATPASAIVRRHDVADSSYRNYDPSVVFLFAPNGLIVGTGVVIAPDWVLTSAKVVDRLVVDDFSGGAGSGANFVDSAVFPFGAGIKSLHQPSGWNGSEASGFDIGLVQFHRAGNLNPVSPTNHSIQRNSSTVASLVGSQVDIQGYGDTGTGAAGITALDGYQRRATNFIDGQGSLLNSIYIGGPYSSNIVVADFDGVGAINRWGSGTPTSREGSVAASGVTFPALGDAGAPWMIGDTVAAITSFAGSNDFQYGDASAATAVSPHNNWINSTMGGVNWNTRTTVGYASYNAASNWGDGRVPASGDNVQFSLPYVSPILYGAPYINFAQNTSVGNMAVEFGPHVFNIGTDILVTSNSGRIDVDRGGEMVVNGTGLIRSTADTGTSSGIIVGNTGAGRFVQNGPTVQVTRSLMLGYLDSSTDGTYILNSGTLRILNGLINVGDRGRGDFEQNQNTTVESVVRTPRLIVGDEGVGEYRLNGGTIRSDLVQVGLNAAGTGNFLMNGGSLRSDLREGQTQLKLEVGSRGKGLMQQTGGTVTADWVVVGVNESAFDNLYEFTYGVINTNSMDVGHTSNGRFEQSGGTVEISGTLSIASFSTSTGSYRLSNGTLDVSSGQIVYGDGDGQFDFVGGKLHVGTVFGDLSNQGGTLAPGNSAGRTDILGAYTQSNDASLEIEIGGTTQGSTYDFVDIYSGTAALAGNLLLSLIDGFQPGPSDVFEILRTAGISGAFDNAADGARLATVDGLGSFVVDYVDGDVLLRDFLLTAPSLAGDYNNDGTVDAADYTVWRDNVGTSNTLQNDPIGGMIGTEHYSQWKSNFGMQGGGGSIANAAVPEPSGLFLAVAIALCVNPGRLNRPPNCKL